MKVRGFRPDIILRAGTPDDESFIYSSWLKAHFDMGANIKAIDRRTFESHHRDVIKRLLGRGQILVAGDPEMPGLIYGWTVFEPIGAQLCLHYCYVRGSQRRFGIGRRLYEAAKAITNHDEDLDVIVSHYTPSWPYIDRGAVYIPYAHDEAHHPMIISMAVLKLGGSSRQASVS